MIFFSNLRSIAKHLSELRDDNKKLLSERDNLRALLKDREEDVKLTRDQLVQERRKAHDSQLMQRSADHFCPRSRDTDELVKRLERLQLKYSALKSDLQVFFFKWFLVFGVCQRSYDLSLTQSLLDEKEDLVQERDSYKCKVHRLNHSMSALLKCDGYKTIDLDWLLAENTFLRDNLNNAIEEKQLANDMGRR